MNQGPAIKDERPLLRFDSIEKSFFGVRVLKAVSFDVHTGRVTGLVGENGAGKSTLMNLLGGNLRPDAGRMLLAGRPHAPRSPAEARRAGVAFVHQELNLFPNLTIAENLSVAGFPTCFPGLIDGAAVAVRARGLLERVGLDLPPATPLERLAAGERQLVEIAKALGDQPRVLILDEPTTSLTARECARLFSLMRRLRDDGLALIFISHALGDVLREGDDLVILRDGAVVGGGPAKDFDQRRLVSLMVGRELGQLFPTRRGGSLSAPGGRGGETMATTNLPANPSPQPSPLAGERETEAGPLLEVRAVTQPGVVRDISFRLHRGEILGVAGLMGAGRSELARILFGLDPHASGEMLLEGRPLQGGPRRRIARGLALLTEDRRAEGLCLEAAIADNLALVTLRDHARTPARWLNAASLRGAVARIREAVRLTPAARDAQPVQTLSGGNQQKVVLGKWLLARPRMLILDEPTRGIDVGAKFEIYQLIQQLADDGAGVLVISSELEELLGLCDRILVLAQGRLRADLPRAECSQERLLEAALPA